MRLIYAGTPEVAVPTLRRLVQGPHEVAAVITRQDAPVGRRRLLTPSPVAVAAEELDVPVIRANRLDADVAEQVAAKAPDLGVIVAYGGLVREPLLSTPRHGWINLHFSLLPRWRGAAPVQRAIIAGDTVTGASVFQLVAELDAGDVFAQVERPIGVDETAGDVLDALADDGADLVNEVVNGIADGTLIARPQVGDPTVAPKLSTADGELDWNRPVAEVFAQLRGVTPEPGAFTHVNGTRVKVLKARRTTAAPRLPAGGIRADSGAVLIGTADDPLELLTVQPAGRSAMDAASWWRGMGAQHAVAR